MKPIRQETKRQMLSTLTEWIEEWIEVELQAQAINANISLDEWEYTVHFDEHLHDLHQVVVRLVRQIAELDRVEELVTEWKLVQFSRTPFKRSVWNQIKVSWLGFFRRYCGLTAPFWQPELCKVTYYEYVPVTYTKTNLTKIVARPGTRRYLTRTQKRDV